MRRLLHYPLCPFSRSVRLVLFEKRLDFSLEFEKFWEKRSGFLKMNPLGHVPVLIDLNGITLSDGLAICEYLEEAYPEPRLMGEDLLKKTEVRRLVGWFHRAFAQDVSLPLCHEKVLKRFFKDGLSSGPNSTSIRIARSHLPFHLDYIGWLVDRRNWLAGESFSIADCVAAAHLSVVDFLGDVNWAQHASAQEWYARIKSRPSFRSLLQDSIPGLVPAPHYTNLDF